MFRFIGDLLSPAGGRGKLSILYYHRTLAAPDTILHDEIDAATFERHMALLAAEFNVLALGEACARGIMFNDGVIEAVRRAPAGIHDLSSLGLGSHILSDDTSRRATIDALIKQLMYRPREVRDALVEQLAAAMHSTLPKNLIMSPTQIKRLHDEGMEIGGHTVNHSMLTLFDEAASPLGDRWRQASPRGNHGGADHAVRLSGWLPKEIVARKKRGFGAPMGAWLRNDLGPVVGNLLSETQIKKRGLLNWTGVEQIIHRHMAEKSDYTDQLLALINLELWCRIFLDGLDYRNAAAVMGSE